MFARFQVQGERWNPNHFWIFRCGHYEKQVVAYGTTMALHFGAQRAADVDTGRRSIPSSSSKLLKYLEVEVLPAAYAPQKAEIQSGNLLQLELRA